MCEVDNTMIALQDYPGALVLTLLLWVICSVAFCFSVGYLVSRIKHQRRGSEGPRHHGPAL